LNDNDNEMMEAAGDAADDAVDRGDGHDDVQRCE